MVPEGIGQKIDSRGVYWFEDMSVLRFRRTITIREGTFFNEGGGSGCFRNFLRKKWWPTHFLEYINAWRSTNTYTKTSDPPSTSFKTKITGSENN